MPTSTRPRRVVVALASLGAVAGSVAGCTSERSADLDRPAATAAPEDNRDDGAVSLVEDLQRALTRPSAPEVGTSDAAAAAEIRSAAANVRALRLREVTLRYLAPSTDTLSDAEQARYGDDAWVADVQVSWQVPRVEPRPAVLTIPVVLSGAGADQQLVTFDADAADHVPLWLLTRLSVVRGPRSIAAAPERAAARRLSVLAERAVTTVRRTLPAWRETLLVQEAPDQRAFQVAAGLPAAQARAVAAVTTTADGSGDRTARGEVFVNPRLYDPLGQDGRQIVVSHESAHVALGAATTQMPLWLSEGTADWIALRYSTLPVDRLASQVLAWVRDSGGPRDLPGPTAFDGSDKRIGAWYEAAWLAVRRLADTYGAAGLLRFYRAAEGSTSTQRAFRTLGTTQAAFVQDWRAYLRSLA